MSRVIPTERDLSILSFLWKWKMMPTAGLLERFFYQCKPKTGYQRLLALKKSGFIRIQCDNEARNFFWTLTQKGFNAIRHNMYELKDDGFRSEAPDHDFILAAVHIGDWLREMPENAGRISEQQLRRMHPEHLPSWVAKRPFHRPDGYWNIPYQGKMVTITLEVELSRKTDSDYGVLAHFYKDHPSMFRVIWFVPNESFARCLHQKFFKEVGESSLKHNFVSLEAYRKTFWQTPFCIGYEAGKTIESLFNDGRGTSPGPFLARCLLDGRRCPWKSKQYGIYREMPERHCIGITPIQSPLPSDSPSHTPSSISLAISSPTPNCQA